MTAYEAARKWGIPSNQLSKWCKSGKVNATKVKFGNRWKWIIPDDHPQPNIKTGISRERCSKKLCFEKLESVDTLLNTQVLSQ